MRGSTRAVGTVPQRALAQLRQLMTQGGRGQQNRKSRTIAEPVAVVISVFASWVGPATQPAIAKPRARYSAFTLLLFWTWWGWDSQQLTWGLQRRSHSMRLEKGRSS